MDPRNLTGVAGVTRPIIEYYTDSDFTRGQYIKFRIPNPEYLLTIESFGCSDSIHTNGARIGWLSKGLKGEGMRFSQWPAKEANFRLHVL